MGRLHDINVICFSNSFKKSFVMSVWKYLAQSLVRLVIEIFNLFYGFIYITVSFLEH